MHGTRRRSTRHGRGDQRSLLKWLAIPSQFTTERNSSRFTSPKIWLVTSWENFRQRAPLRGTALRAVKTSQSLPPDLHPDLPAALRQHQRQGRQPNFEVLKFLGIL